VREVVGVVREIRIRVLKVEVEVRVRAMGVWVGRWSVGRMKDRIREGRREGSQGDSARFTMRWRRWRGKIGRNEDI
jgi:hypothetical protein